MRRHPTKGRVKLDLPMKPEVIYPNIIKRALVAGTLPEKEVLLGHLRARRYDLLLEWSERVSPQLYDSPTSYFVAAQLSALIKKYPFSEKQVPGISPGVVAYEKFLSAEHRCKRINLRADLRKKASAWEPYAEIYAYARSYISSTIGFTPNLEEIALKADITPGAAIGVHGNKTNLARKLLAEDWTCTRAAIPYAVACLGTNDHYFETVLTGRPICYDRSEFIRLCLEKITVVDYNKIEFVPKTARTDRCIAVEPLLNGLVQNGVDTFMRRCLMRRGIDLSDQSKNARLAKAGSIPGQFNPYATIDLSAASDTISETTVQDLLPPKWFDLLNDLRSPAYLDPTDGKVKNYHKFVSMGNGFCFPLESLIFAALSFGVLSYMNEDVTDFSVYGDDIIIRQSAALLLKEVFADKGFTMNTEKSFIVGPFKESCGSDWYEGQDVRPVFLKKQLVDLRQLFSLHNTFLRSPRTEIFSEEIREYLRSFAPALIRPGREATDTCFNVSLDQFMGSSSSRWKRDTQTWSWTELMSFSVKDKVEGANSDALASVTHAAILRGSSPEMPFALRYTTKVRRIKVSRPWSCRYVPLPRFNYNRWLGG